MELPSCICKALSLRDLHEDPHCLPSIHAVHTVVKSLSPLQRFKRFSCDRNLSAPGDKLLNDRPFISPSKASVFYEGPQFRSDVRNIDVLLKAFFLVTQQSEETSLRSFSASRPTPKNSF